MRPRLPLIRSSDPITEASASDRGWIRRHSSPDLQSHFLFFWKLLARYDARSFIFWKLLARYDARTFGGTCSLAV
jgi:hypothetical protein